MRCDGRDPSSVYKMIGRSEDICNVFDTGTPQAVLNRSLLMAHTLLVGVDEISGKTFDYVIIGTLLSLCTS